MRTLSILAAVTLAASAQAGIISSVDFTLTTDGGGIPLWNFTIGIADTATDAFDGGLDSLEPPWSPGPEVRMHTLGVPGALGAMNQDYRDDLVEVDVSGHWTPAGDPVRDEVWGLGALDAAYTDLCTIDGANLGLIGVTTGTITWDLTGAGGWQYYLYCLDTNEEIALGPGGSYAWSVSNRFGMGPTLVVSCTAPIPEPGTLLLVGVGLAGAIAKMRRQQ